MIAKFELINPTTFLAALMVFILLVALIMGYKNRGSNDAVLEWNVEETYAWRLEVEEDEAPAALAIYNKQRIAEGKPVVTLDQYIDAMRRQARD